MKDHHRMRAWDGGRKCYWNFHIKHPGVFVCENYPELELDLWEIFESCFKVEQCTGLRDKNGKLIYEGDICIYEFNYSMGDAISEVIFKDGCFCFDWGDSASDNGLFGMHLKDTEIIGNIHENPELLK